MPVPKRSKALAAAASARISAEATRIAEERKISFDEAVRAVFEDRNLLQECHNVKLPEDFE